MSRRYDRLREDLKALLSRHSAELVSGTPDYVLAEYLVGCLRAYDAASRERDLWHGRVPGDPSRPTEVAR